MQAKLSLCSFIATLWQQNHSSLFMKKERKKRFNIFKVSANVLKRFDVARIVPQRRRI